VCAHTIAAQTTGLFPAETHQFAAEQQTSRCADGTTFSGIGSGPVLVLSPSLTGPSQAHQTASGVTNASHSSAEVVRTPSTATGPHGKFAPIGPITTLPTNGHQLCQGLQIAPGKALSVGDVQLLEPSRDPYVIAGFWHHNSWRAVVVRAGDQQYGKVEDQPASHLKQKYQGNRAADFAANSSNHTALFERAKTWAESKQPVTLKPHFSRALDSTHNYSLCCTKLTMLCTATRFPDHTTNRRSCKLKRCGSSRWQRQPPKRHATRTIGCTPEVRLLRTLRCVSSCLRAVLVQMHSLSSPLSTARRRQTKAQRFGSATAANAFAAGTRCSHDLTCSYDSG